MAAGSNSPATADDTRVPLYFDLSPVDARAFEEDLRDAGIKKERWMIAHMTARLVEEEGVGREGTVTTGLDDGDATVVEAAKRRGVTTSYAAGEFPARLPSERPVGEVPPPMPEYICCYCEGRCLFDRPAIPVPVQLRKDGDGKIWQVRGVACRYPCAAAELFRRAGGEACGGTAIRRDEYMRGADYLRIMYFVMTGERWGDDWPRSPPPQQFLAKYGMGGAKGPEDFARAVALLDPYEAWTRRGPTTPPPSEARERAVEEAAVTSLGLALA